MPKTIDMCKGYKSYIMEPYNINYWETLKPDGMPPKLIIGKFCSIAINCTFMFTHHSMGMVTTSPRAGSSYARGDIIIGNDVWIGANCTIMDNVVLGDGCVVGTGSIVTKSVPPYAIVAGNPAKVIRYRFSEDIIQKMLDIHLWDLPDSELSKLNLWTEDIESFVDSIKNYTIDDQKNTNMLVRNVFGRSGSVRRIRFPKL